MTKERILNKYRKSIVGFAYEYFTPEHYSYGVKTYIVIKKGNYHSFVNYEIHKLSLKEDFKLVCQTLINLGYQPLSYWTDLNNTITNGKQYTKAKRFRRK